MKKLIFLLLLVAAAYVGYGLWQKLSKDEKAAVKEKVDHKIDQAKEFGDEVVDKLSPAVKGAIQPSQEGVSE